MQRVRTTILLFYLITTKLLKRIIKLYMNKLGSEERVDTLDPSTGI